MQRLATMFLIENALHTPRMFVRPEQLRRMEPTGVMDRIRTAQNSIMNSMLQANRLNRIVEQSALDPGAYAPIDYLTDVRNGVWSELATGSEIDPFRRNTQRVYLDTANNRLNGGSTPPSGEVRALLRGELRTLRDQIATALETVTDPATRLHLEDSVDIVNTTLDPRAMRERSTAAGGGGGRGITQELASSIFGFDYDNDPFLTLPAVCWPDYVIR
jgi:hypothetical protein